MSSAEPVIRPSLPAARHQRLNRHLIVFAIFLLLAVAAVVGILLALGNSEPKPPAIPGADTAAARASGPGPGSPLPTVGTPAPSIGQFESSTVAISPGTGWGLAVEDKFGLALLDPRKIGILQLESRHLETSNVVEYAQSLIASALDRTTGGRICGKIEQVRVPNGPAGLGIPLCYTVVPQSGEVRQFVAVILAGIGGRNGVTARFTSTPGAFQTFTGEAGPAMGTVRWKLLTS